MPEEAKGVEIEVEDTTDPTAPTDEGNDTSEQDGEPVEKTDDVDYAAQLEAAQTRYKKAEDKIVKLKREEKDTPDISELVKETVEKQLQEFKLGTLRATLDDEVAKVSKNDDEANLIKFYLENKIRLSGDIRADVRDAKVLANAERLIETNNELRVALKSGQTSSSAEATSYKQPKEPKDQPSGSTKRFNDYMKSAADRIKREYPANIAKTVLTQK